MIAALLRWTDLGHSSRSAAAGGRCSITQKRPPAASQNLEFSDGFNAWSEEKSPKKRPSQLQA
jgi:hypothetical protein